jgi:hypothetical protein
MSICIVVFARMKSTVSTLMKQSLARYVLRFDARTESIHLCAAIVFFSLSFSSLSAPERRLLKARVERQSEVALRTVVALPVDLRGTTTHILAVVVGGGDLIAWSAQTQHHLSIRRERWMSDTYVVVHALERIPSNSSQRPPQPALIGREAQHELGRAFVVVVLGEGDAEGVYPQSSASLSLNCKE